MKHTILRGALLILALVFGVAAAARIDPDLMQRLQAPDNPNQKFPVDFYLKAQTRALALDAGIADLPKPLRRARVREVLTEFNNATQANLLRFLRGKQAEGKVEDISPLWLVNSVMCWATKDVIYDVAARDDIELVYYDKIPVEMGKQTLKAPPVPRDGVEPNLITTNARGAWSQGYTGQGTVLGIVDTGVWYTHDDLAGHLWSSPAYPNCGFNFASSQYSSGHPGPSTYDTLTPLDYYGHGTHCAGIATADGTYGNGTHDTMGIAPSALILACPVDVYLHTPYPDTSMENNMIAGFQFCVSPTRDPTNGADAITTSLGLISAWLPRRAIFRQVEVNIMDAGLAHCTAAGNEGPTTRTIRTAGDCPPPWPNPANNPTDHATSAVITIGATDNADNAASFTSIGPSDWGSVAPYNDYVYPPGLMDPDACMPGVNILSTYFTGNQSYTQMSGTSMATPGATGVCLLMLSKNPNLTPREIDSIIENYAVRDLGTPGKDDTFGAGRINCSLAVAMTPLPTGIRTIRWAIDDAPPNGNGDGVINPGETINLPVWVRNLNGYPTLGVRGYFRILAPDPNVTLIDTFKPFGDIPIDDSAYTGAQGFKFSVASGCSNGYSLPFVLACQDTVDSIWYNPIGLRVGTASLVGAGRVVHDPPPGGNGNGNLDPGETADLEIGVRNVGGGNAANVAACLVSLDSRFQITDSLGAYGAIRHDTTVFNTADQFRVHADGTIPREFMIPCSLRITATGYAATRYLEIPCGVLTQSDPIPDGPRTPASYYAYDDVDVFYTEHPTYNWIELRGRGTQMTLSDDQTTTIPIPSAFGAFRYYGNDYTQLSICSNGFVMPGTFTYAAWTNQQLPYPTAAAPLICVNWDDLYPPDGGGVWYFHDTASHAFVVEYDSVGYYPSGSGRFDKFEVVLYDSTTRSLDGNNEFAYQYMTADYYTSNTVGIQDPTFAIAIPALYNGAYHRACAPLAAGRAIKFTTDSVTTSISEERLVTTPLRLGLYALGSPFRNTAQIRFSLPGPTQVKLIVYDIAGREVRTLVSSPKPLTAGTYSLTWNGADNAGKPVAGGVYLYRLETARGTISRKTVKIE